MQRDKKGRFVKKAQAGLQFPTTVTLNNKTYKVKPGASQAFASMQSKYKTFGDFLQSSDGSMWLENNTFTPSFTPSQIYSDKTSTQLAQEQAQKLDVNKVMGGDSLPDWLAPKKIKYRMEGGRNIDQFGNEISMQDLLDNSHRYELDLTTSGNSSGNGSEGDPEGEESKGMNWTKIGESLNNVISQPINKTKLADFLEYTRAGIGASINNKVADRALKAEKPFLQDVSESHRSVYGDYRSQIQGEKAAAQLRNMASKPMTSDGALQQQMMLDATIKGQEYIEQGRAKDDAMMRQTREVAWQQEKENQQQRQAVAMQNRQALLMSEKNKAQIENMRDSANFSQVISPLLQGKEQRLRNKGAEQEHYQEYYENALMSNNVWNTHRDGLSETQKKLADIYSKQGYDAFAKYATDNNIAQADVDALVKLMKEETIRRQALLKGVNLSGFGKSLNSPYSFWEYAPGSFKKGGTVYKAKLTKRTKDNDRGSKSIESSKKIAARFLEKAIDSLYDYTDVELIAKPKKRRKYQAGGGLPFVNFTPVFATSEKGAPSASSKTDKEDLTSKDVLQLLKDMDGLPSDMAVIVQSLQNFELQESMDPLGLSSSSDIASRYISLINKIKVAKFNREEYNNAFNQLKGNGGLNEFAITSDGYLIGENEKGDFQKFTADQINAGLHTQHGYELLTNSNLLYKRANVIDTAFNHELTTVAQSGIGMEVVTKQISDIIQGLGSSKESQEGFVQMGSKGQIKQGLEYLQKAAKEVGDDSINQNMSVADYYQAGYLTEDQADQAQLALTYISNTLPTNMRTLLQVKGGSPEGAEALVKSLVLSKTKTESQFKATPKKMTKSSSSSSSGDGVDELKLSPVQMMQVGYTDHQPVTLQKGTKYAMHINAQVLPITDVNKKLLGVTTLDKVAESTFGGALDMNNVTMGSQLIDPHALQNVQIDSTNLYVMNLPIDKNSPDGTIKPDLAWMTKIEAIDETIREQGITDIATINKLYTDAGLPVLMDDKGQLNVKDYCKFGVLNGHAMNSAFKDLDLLDNTMVEIDDEDQIKNIMSVLNKDRGEKDRLDFDSKSWADSIFGTDHDSIYEGTIYIPVRTNAFTGMIGGGQYPDTATAAEVEALIQQKERTRGYVDPGLLN